MPEQIIRSEYSEVMQKSYIDYAMSVITARALPDVRDGLKPVQRRVLYAMDQLGLNYDKPHRKSARIVGDTMGKFHPHGDSSIYDALVVMEQDFKKGMALVDGHGNFGSIEGDGAAAMRYTEAKLKKFTQDVYLKDLDKDVVNFVPNFDETEREPEVLPVRVPNILINGAEGIAVGMTTSIPTHNLGEVVDAVIAYIDNDKITNQELMTYVKGPDFPTGGIMVNRDELPAIYETGVGKIKVRGKVEFEPTKKRSERDRLVITEIPYTMIGAGIGKFIQDVCDLIETKKTSDIVDVSNQSSKEGIRIVLELRKGCDVEKLENLLYKKTKLEDTFGVNMLAIADGKPETLSLKDIIRHHVNFQYEVARRKYTNLLEKARIQKEIKEGLIRACNIIDLIIEIIRGSHDQKQAKRCLMTGDTEGIKFRHKESELQAANLNFTERQAQAILEMRLYRLIGLEILALQKEYEELASQVAAYEEILSSPRAMKRVIKKDLAAIKKEYDVPRRTVIINGKKAVYVEEAPEAREAVLVMDRFGYTKMLEPAVFEKNREFCEKEFRHMCPCMTTDKILIFTRQGMVHQIRAQDVPLRKLKEKGIPADNLCNYDSSREDIAAVCCLTGIVGRKLLFATKKGMVKLVDGGEFDVAKRTVAASKLAEGDEILDVVVTDARTIRRAADRSGSENTGKAERLSEKSQKEVSAETAAEAGVGAQGENATGGLVTSEILILQTAEGYFLRLQLADIPEKKKNALGVRGIRLGDEDTVTDVYVLRDGENRTVTYREKEIVLRKLKTGRRDSRGTKTRLK
ncbi:MAG: DNA topoisomerase 4 subunit A [Lachnospiraceae bacterium]|nr:DNA topoisomerase 4 subunit A [Lachnospiraceae bacterium]